MRASRVVGFRPRTSAAPPIPRTRQPVFPEHPQDVLALHVLEAPCLPPSGTGSASPRGDGHRDAQHGPGLHDHRALDQVAQLADVTGPGVLPQGVEAGPGDRVEPLAQRRRRSPRRGPSPGRDVFAAFAQRGHARSGRRSGGRRDRSRNVPSRTASSRSRLVAAMMRTSTDTGRGLPSRSKVRSCRTRSSLIWTSSGRSPISSRNSVEPSAISNRPICFERAPV